MNYVRYIRHNPVKLPTFTQYSNFAQLFYLVLCSPM